jgi:short-subunit dehydrogenase
MRPPLDGTVLVTGASGGIGAALVRELAVTASALVLVARRGDLLTALAEELRAARPALFVHTFVCDLADAAALEELCERIEREVGTIDVLVNNAGIGDQSFVEQARWDRLGNLLALNVVAPTRLCARFVPGMVARGRGGVLNVSSAFAFSYLPGFAAYAASKHYVTAFTDTLRAELAGTGVVVTQLLPGPVATEFLTNSEPTTPLAPPAFVMLTAERCAKAALAGFGRNRAMVVPGWLFVMVTWVSRTTPRFVMRVFASILARLQRPRLKSGH